MPITSFHITNFRNISSVELLCSPRFNLFFGDNGAGKTSVLEAIYYLGTGKSFRTHHHDRIIQHQKNQTTLFARSTTGTGDIPLGLQRLTDGSLQIRINDESVSSIAEVSQHLPIQCIVSDSHRILSDGPKSRRQFLDWGLFHTHPQFYPQWKNFQKVLTQRNAALKSKASQDELSIWNHAFSIAGEALDVLRHDYIAQFLPFFNEIMRILLENVSVDVEYTPGWNKNTPLLDFLSQNVSRETLLGYSLYGPHRADLTMAVDGLPAQDVLSQGQQKLVSYSLRLAQGLHLQSITGKSPIYLIDDLPSELDIHKRKLVTEILSKIQAQVFITGIEACDLDDMLALDNNNQMFHVKHGVVVLTERRSAAVVL